VLVRISFLNLPKCCSLPGCLFSSPNHDSFLLLNLSLHRRHLYFLNLIFYLWFLWFSLRIYFFLIYFTLFLFLILWFLKIYVNLIGVKFKEILGFCISKYFLFLFDFQLLHLLHSSLIVQQTQFNRFLNHRCFLLLPCKPSLLLKQTNFLCYLKLLLVEVLHCLFVLSWWNLNVLAFLDLLLLLLT
jgi:hypothetical protein